LSPLPLGEWFVTLGSEDDPESTAMVMTNAETVNFFIDNRKVGKT
jgi:hypothetical protein